MTSVALFATSAIYHMGTWLPPTKAMLRRADHSNIFLIIAGTYTPLSLLLLPPDDARTLLIVVWSGALAGVLIRNFWLTAPRWVYVPDLRVARLGRRVLHPRVRRSRARSSSASSSPAACSTRSARSSTRRSGRRSARRWFGFHEMFHSFTIAGFLAHFAAIALAIVAFA